MNNAQDPTNQRRYGIRSDPSSRDVNHVAVLWQQDRQILESILADFASSIYPLSAEEKTARYREAINLLCWH